MQADDAVCCAFERLLDVDRGVQLLTIDSQDAIAEVEVQSGLGERSFFTWVEVAARVDLCEAVAVVFDYVVCAKQTAGNGRSGWNRAAVATKMADGEGSQH